MSATIFTCAKCGSSFDVPPATLTRFPGWIPRACLACRDTSRNGSKNDSKAAASGSTRPKIANGRSLTATRDLSPEDVLNRFHDGPDTGLFADGSARPNPGAGGWGLAWVEAGELKAEMHGGASETTNNRMELTALIEAYKLAPKGKALPIYTDSELCVNIVTKWAASWERAGWTRKGGPIMNLDLVQELFALSRGRPDLELKWAPAHSGWRWNEYADALANTGRMVNARR